MITKIPNMKRIILGNVSYSNKWFWNLIHENCVSLGMLILYQEQGMLKFPDLNLMDNIFLVKCVFASHDHIEELNKIQVQCNILKPWGVSNWRQGGHLTGALDMMTNSI